MSDRQIDALLAEHLFGWVGVGLRRFVTSQTIGAYDEDWQGLQDKRDMVTHVIPHYSTTWEGMGMVVEAMRAKGYGLYLFAWQDGGTIAEFRCNPEGRPGRNRVVSETTPMAAALAALKALHVEMPA